MYLIYFTQIFCNLLRKLSTGVETENAPIKSVQLKRPVGNKNANSGRLKRQ